MLDLLEGDDAFHQSTDQIWFHLKHDI